MSCFEKAKTVAPAGFEPASPDPESGRIDRYPTGLQINLTLRIYQNFGAVTSSLEIKKGRDSTPPMQLQIETHYS